MNEKATTLNRAVAFKGLQKLIGIGYARLRREKYTMKISTTIMPISTPKISTLAATNMARPISF